MYGYLVEIPRKCRLSTRVTEKNFASRSRKRQSEFRRQQLIDATIDCIDRLGLSQTTLARIAERAGLSQGNVVFHFQSKDALLEQTLQFLNAEYKANWQQALAPFTLPCPAAVCRTKWRPRSQAAKP